MKAATPVDDELHRRRGDAWWDDDVGESSSIRPWINPARCGHFARVLAREGAPARGGRRILGIGCGGGLLAEERTRLGLTVTGIDPAPERVEAARAHAVAWGLRIEYRTGAGESPPGVEKPFDHVAGCDVLEHVDDVELVVGEIARVLAPRGLFRFDTVSGVSSPRPSSAGGSTARRAITSKSPTWATP